MKKIILAFELFLILYSSVIVGQNKNKSNFSFCKLKAEAISFSDLENCPTLTSRNNKLELKSFTISMLVKTKEHPEGLYWDEIITGKTITNEVLLLLKKMPNARSKIFIENIIAYDNGKEKKYQGFTFYLLNPPTLHLNQEDKVFSFCTLKSETIEIVDLEKCPVLASRNKKLELKSFKVSVFVKNENFETPTEDANEGLYMDFPIIGNKLTNEVLEFFKKPHKSHLRVTIADIVASDSGTENKYEGFTFYLH